MENLSALILDLMPLIILGILIGGLFLLDERCLKGEKHIWTIDEEQRVENIIYFHCTKCSRTMTIDLFPMEFYPF